MHTVFRPWGMRSSGAQCDPELAKRLGEEEDWRGEGGGEGEEEEEGEEEGEAALIKSSNPHLAGGEKTLGTRVPLRKTQITTTNDRMSTNAYNESSYSIKSNSLHFEFIQY